QDAVVLFPFVEEPERGWERDGIEHVRGQRQHRVDEVLLDQRPPDVGLGMARVGSGVSHDERGATLGLKRSSKEINPEIVSIRNGFLTLVLLLGLALISGYPVGAKASVL